MAFTIHSAALPLVSFSSDFDKISYFTQSDSAVTVRLQNGDTSEKIFSTTVYPYNYQLTIYELDSVIELYMRQQRLSRLNLSISFLYDDTVFLSKVTDVIYCPLRIYQDREELLAHHFLTLGTYKLSFQHSKETLSAYVMAEESTVQYWTILFRQGEGSPQVRNITINADTTATDSGIVTITVDYDNLLTNLQVSEILSVQVALGARTFTLYYNDNTPLMVFTFRNLYNALEVEAVYGNIERKHETSHSEAIYAGNTTLYDITSSLTYEIETAPLTHVQARRLEEVCKATDIWIFQGSLATHEPQRIIITDYTSEISSQDNKMQNLKISFQFPNPARQDIPIVNQNYSRIFQIPYNHTYK